MSSNLSKFITDPNKTDVELRYYPSIAPGSVKAQKKAVIESALEKSGIQSEYTLDTNPLNEPRHAVIVRAVPREKVAKLLADMRPHGFICPDIKPPFETIARHMPSVKTVSLQLNRNALPHSCDSSQLSAIFSKALAAVADPLKDHDVRILETTSTPRTEPRIMAEVSENFIPDLQSKLEPLLVLKVHLSPTPVAAPL